MLELFNYKVWLAEAISHRKFEFRRRLLAAIDECKFPLHPDEERILLDHIYSEQPKKFDIYPKEVTEEMKTYFFEQNYHIMIEEQRSLAFEYLKLKNL